LSGLTSANRKIMNRNTRIVISCNCYEPCNHRSFLYKIDLPSPVYNIDDTYEIPRENSLDHLEPSDIHNADDIASYELLNVDHKNQHIHINEMRGDTRSSGRWESAR
jgi:hypothetical protein